MDGWRSWHGKEVFIILKNKRQYSGEVIEVEKDESSSFWFLTIKDKFGKNIGFVNSEIELIQEEGE
jgi:hypothetical protein